MKCNFFQVIHLFCFFLFNLLYIVLINYAKQKPIVVGSSLLCISVLKYYIAITPNYILPYSQPSLPLIYILLFKEQHSSSKSVIDEHCIILTKLRYAYTFDFYIPVIYLVVYTYTSEFFTYIASPLFLFLSQSLLFSFFLFFSLSLALSFSHTSYRSFSLFLSPSLSF